MSSQNSEDSDLSNSDTPFEKERSSRDVIVPQLAERAYVDEQGPPSDSSSLREPLTRTATSRRRFSNSSVRGLVDRKPHTSDEETQDRKEGQASFKEISSRPEAINPNLAALNHRQSHQVIHASINSPCIAEELTVASNGLELPDLGFGPVEKLDNPSSKEGQYRVLHEQEGELFPISVEGVSSLHNLAGLALLAPPIQQFTGPQYVVPDLVPPTLKPDLIRKSPTPHINDFSANAQIIRTACSVVGRRHDWTWSKDYDTLYVAVLMSRIDELNTKLMTGLQEQRLLRFIPLEEVPGDFKPLVAFAQTGRQQRIDWMWCEEHMELLKGLDRSNSAMGPEELDILVKRTGAWMKDTRFSEDYTDEE